MCDAWSVFAAFRGCRIGGFPGCPAWNGNGSRQSATGDYSKGSKKTTVIFTAKWAYATLFSFRLLLTGFSVIHDFILFNQPAS